MQEDKLLEDLSSQDTQWSLKVQQKSKALIQEPINDKTRYILLFLIVYNRFAPAVNAGLISAQQVDVMNGMKIDDFQFNILTGSQNIPQMIMPLISIQIIRYFGVFKTFYFTWFLTMTASILRAFSFQFSDYNTCLFSQILFGGSDVVTDFVANIVISEVFIGKQLAFALGALSSFLSIGKFTSNIIVEIYYYLNSNYYNHKLNYSVPSQIQVCLMVFGLIALIMANKLYNQLQLGRDQNIQSSKQSTFKNIRDLNLNYWLFAVSGGLVYSMYNSYVNNQQLFLQTQLNIPKKYSIICQVIPNLVGLFCVPFYSLIIDYFGFRIHQLLIVHGLWFTVIQYYLATYTFINEDNFYYYLILPTFLSCIYFVMREALIFGSIPLLATKESLPTACSLFYFFLYSSCTIFPVIYGYILDATKSQNNCFYMLDCLILISASLQIGLYIKDKDSKQQLLKQPNVELTQEQIDSAQKN